MEKRETVRVESGSEAVFALRITGDDCEPLFRRGDTAYFRRARELRDGDAGLFFDGHGCVVRQYCEDWAGNACLLAINRARSELDLILPAAEGKPVCCFGVLITQRPIPLPKK